MAQPESPDERQAAILIVDDDTGFADMIASVLKIAGYATACARDGQEALERLERESFDVVLLDIWMPRMNGLELLAELRNRWILPKVIVMTGDNTPETILQAVKEQAYQFVPKPFNPKAALEVIEDALEAPPAIAAIEVVSARPEWVELLVPCERNAPNRIQGFLENLDSELPPETRRTVGTAFRELLMNAVEWGGEFDATRKVRITYLRARRMLLYRIADPGRGFRFEELAHAAVMSPPDDPFRHVEVREQMGMRPGGFGIALAKGMVDELIYNEAHNEVVLVKYLD